MIDAAMKNSPMPFPEQLKERLIARFKQGQIPPGSPMPSVRDLARTYGVSKSTAEKTVKMLKDEKFISTRSRYGLFWSDAAKALIYDTIGVSLPVAGGVTPENAPYYYAMLEGMGAVFAKAGVSVKLLRDDILADRYKLSKAHCDAVIFTGSYLPALDKVAVCRSLNIPYLLLDRPMEDDSLNFLERDSEQNLYDMTEFLINQGHAKIGMIVEKRPEWFNEKIRRGYAKAVRKHRLDEEIFIYPLRSDTAFGPNEEIDFMIFAKSVSALLIATPNSHHIREIVRTLLKNHIRVPEDVSLLSLSHANDVSVDGVTPALFSITPETMGAAAAENLLKLALGEIDAPAHVYFKTKIDEGNTIRGVTP